MIYTFRSVNISSKVLFFCVKVESVYSSSDIFDQIQNIFVK